MHGFAKKILLSFFATFVLAGGIFAPATARAGLWEDVTSGVGDFVGGVVDGGKQLIGGIIDEGGKLVGEIGKIVGEIGQGIADAAGEVTKAIKSVTKIQLPPPIDMEIDITEGIQAIQQKFADKLPDEIPIWPKPPLKLYPKETPASNVIKNIAPALSGVMEIADPMKPIASLARGVIHTFRPLFDSVVKPLLPDFIKNGAHAAKDFINKTLKAVQNPVMDLVLTVWDFFVGPLDDLVYDIVDLLAEEIKVPVPPHEGGSGEVGRGEDPGTIKIPDPVKNTSPFGELMGIDEQGRAFGWARDNDTPGRAVPVEFIIDGIREGADADANSDNPAGINVDGKHGFYFDIPGKWRDGKPHSITALAFDTVIGEWANIITLPGSPKQFTLSGSIVGAFDTLTDEGTVAGWAVDADVPNGAEVEFYLDKPKDQGGVFLGTTKADKPSAFEAYWLQKLGATNNLIAFNQKIDFAKIVGRHTVRAYAKDYNAITGETKFIELEGSPKTIQRPEVYELTFGENPYKVSPGQWVAQTVTGLPGEIYYQLGAYIDGLKLDLNEHRRSSYANPWDVGNTLQVGGYGDAKVLGPKEFRFRIPTSLPRGTYQVTLKIEDSYVARNYILQPASFTLEVVDIPPIKITAADSMTVGEFTEFTIENTPRFVSFGGKDLNTSLKYVSLLGTPEVSWGVIPSVNLTEFHITPLPNGGAKVRARVPKEAAKLRKDNGPVRMYVVIEASRQVSQDAFVVSYPYEIGRLGKTKAGNDPELILSCDSSRKPEIHASIDSYGDAGFGLSFTGKNFACYSSLSLSVSGETLGKPFKETVVNYPVDEHGEAIGVPNDAKPILSRLDIKTNWDGSIESVVGFGPDWITKYSDTESINLTITDAEGNSATTIVNFDVAMRVLPPEGQSHIYPGDSIRVWVKYATVGLRVEIAVDGRVLKRPMLENRGEEIITGIYLWDDIAPGEHVLTFNGKPKKFLVLVPEEKEKESPKKLEKQKEEKTSDFKEVIIDPKVSVLPLTAKPGMKISIQLSGFHPLAGTTIYLKGQGRNDKLSGYADFTDSFGSMSKDVTLNTGLSAGTYVIEVVDIAGSKAKTTLIVDVPPPPKPDPKPEPLPELDPTPQPLPEPEPVPLPTPEPDPTPQPEPEPEPNPDCPAGFTYSPTFKQCIEDAPAEDNPYADKPCNEYIPMYQQKGCIPQ